MQVSTRNEDYSEWIVGEEELRPCGGCKACCSALAVMELDKPSYSQCRHECETGCAIYSQRPETCRSFMCLWKLPTWLLTEADRPDRLGVVFCVRNREESQQLELWELWPGAAQQPRVRALLDQILVEHVVVTPLTWSIVV